MFSGVIGDAGLCDGLERLFGKAEGLSGIPFDERGFWRSDDTALLQQRQWSTPELRRERGVLCHAPTGVRLVGWLRIDNRDDLRRRLDADTDGLGATDGGLVLLAWLRWGAELCGHLTGDFAFAIHDPRDRSCTLVRDPMGVKPLYYMETGGALAFATGVGVLTDLAARERGERLTLSEEWLARYLAGCAVDRERTVWNEVRKVPPAHLLRFWDGRAELRRHFAFDPEVRDGFGSGAERLEAYRALLAEATACRVRTDDPVASELSGGLDSSTVTAHAALAMPDAGERLHGLGYAFHEQEPEAILSVSQTVPIASTQIITGSRSFNNSEANERRAHRLLGMPVEHINAISYMPVYGLAVGAGARVLLSGFGGDEFVTVRDTAPAQEELWRAGRYAAWARHFPGNAVTRPLRGLRWRRRFRATCLAEELVVRRVAEETFATCVLSDDARKAHGIRARLLRGVEAYEFGERTLSEFCLDRWDDNPGFTARLENCTLVAAGHGLDYRWPLLDVRMIAFFLAIPAEETVGPNGTGRHLHRRAVEGTLPELVVRHRKAMGPPVRIQTRWRYNLPAGEAIDPGHGDLNAEMRGLVDPERFGCAMDMAAKVQARVRSGLPPQRHPGDRAPLNREHRHNVLQLHRWLSVVDEG